MNSWLLFDPSYAGFSKLYNRRSSLVSDHRLSSGTGDRPAIAAFTVYEFVSAR